MEKRKTLQAFSDLFNGKRFSSAGKLILVHVESEELKQKAEWILQHQTLINPRLKGFDYKIFIDKIIAPSINGIDPFDQAILMIEIWGE